MHRPSASIKKFWLRWFQTMWHIITRWLYCVECPQYSIRLEALGICALAVYFLHLTRPSITWLNTRSSLAACNWLMSAISAMPSASNRVRRRGTEWPIMCWCAVKKLLTRPPSQKIWGGFLYGVYRPEEWLWVDSNGKNGNYASSNGIIW